jgi:hypothetical protein
MLALIVPLLLPLCASVAAPAVEELEYRITWGAVPVGWLVIKTEWVEQDGRRLLAVTARARSTGLASLLYPVADEASSLMEESLRPLRFSKTTDEGGLHRSDVLSFDYSRSVAHWTDAKGGRVVSYEIPPDIDDLVSLLYKVRDQDLQPGGTQSYRIAFEDGLHDLTVSALGREEIRCGRGGAMPCIKLEVRAARDGLFVRKIPRQIWVSDDARKVIVRMYVKIPLGTVETSLVRRREVMPAPALARRDGQ